MRELGYHVSDTPAPSECASPPRPPSTSTGSSSTAEWRPPGGSRRFNQWLEDGPARNTRAARGRAENLEGGVGRQRRETNERREPQPSLTQSSRRGILKNGQGSRAVSTAALTDIIANHANQENNPNGESQNTVTMGSGLYVELPEQTRPAGQSDAPIVPTQHDNQDEETITVPRSNTEGIPGSNMTGQGLITLGSTEEVRSIPDTREATSMDEEVLLWTTAQSEGDEQSVILLAGPTASTTIIHLDDPPVRPEPPTQEERRIEPPVSSASEITEAKTEPVDEVEDERPPPAEERRNDDVPAPTNVETVVEIHPEPTEFQATTPVTASTTDSSLSSIVLPGQATGGRSTAPEGVPVPTEVETSPTEMNSAAAIEEPHASPVQPVNEAVSNGERLEQMPSAIGGPALSITGEPSVMESMVTANTGLTKEADVRRSYLS